MLLIKKIKKNPHTANIFNVELNWKVSNLIKLFSGIFSRKIISKTGIIIAIEKVSKIVVKIIPKIIILK